MENSQHFYIGLAAVFLHVVTFFLSLYVIWSPNGCTRKQKVLQTFFILLLPLVGPAIVFGLFKPQKLGPTNSDLGHTPPPFRH